MTETVSLPPSVKAKATRITRREAARLERQRAFGELPARVAEAVRGTGFFIDVPDAADVAALISPLFAEHSLGLTKSEVLELRDWLRRGLTWRGHLHEWGVSFGQRLANEAATLFVVMTVSGGVATAAGAYLSKEEARAARDALTGDTWSIEPVTVRR